MRRVQRVAFLVVVTAICFGAFALAGDVSGPSTTQKNTDVEFEYTGNDTPYQWCYGDGSCTAWGAQPKKTTHSYKSAGTYTVTVTVYTGKTYEPHEMTITVVD